MKLTSVSNSSLTTYNECPAKFHFLYVRNIKPDTKSLALCIGGAVHKVLAEQYSQLKNNAIMSHEKAIEVFEKALRKESVDFKNTTLEESLKEYKPILKIICDNPLPVKPNKVENFCKVDFINPLTKEKLEPKLSTVIDLTTTDDMIIEHKTSTAKYKDTNILGSYQHVIYKLSYKQIYHREPTKILYHVIYKNANSVPELFEVKVTNDDINDCFEWAKKTIININNDIWTSSPSWKCNWCPYNNICPDSR